MYIQSTQYMGWASEFDWHQLSISLGTLVAAYRQALQDNFPMKNSPDSEVKRKLIVIWQKNYSMIQWQKLFLVIAVTIPIYTMLKHHTWVGETHLKLWDRQFFTEKKYCQLLSQCSWRGFYCSIQLFQSAQLSPWRLSTLRRVSSKQTFLFCSWAAAQKCLCLSQVPQPTCFWKWVGRTNPLKSGIWTLKVIFTAKTKSRQLKLGIFGIPYAWTTRLTQRGKKIPHKIFH